MRLNAARCDECHLPTALSIPGFRAASAKGVDVAHVRVPALSRTESVIPTCAWLVRYVYFIQLHLLHRQEWRLNRAVVCVCVCGCVYLSQSCPLMQAYVPVGKEPATGRVCENISLQLHQRKVLRVKLI